VFIKFINWVTNFEGNAKGELIAMIATDLLRFWDDKVREKVGAFISGFMARKSGLREARK